MAEPVNFPGTNVLLGAPKGSENVSPLPIYRNGICCVSAWELSDEEIEEIVRSRVVFLSVLSGNTQPPVFVGSETEVRRMCADYGVWKR